MYNVLLRNAPAPLTWAKYCCGLRKEAHSPPPQNPQTCRKPELHRSWQSKEPKTPRKAFRPCLPAGAQRSPRSDGAGVAVAADRPHLALATQQRSAAKQTHSGHEQRGVGLSGRRGHQRRRQPRTRRAPFLQGRGGGREGKARAAASPP